MPMYLTLLLLLLIPSPSSAILDPGDFLALQSIHQSLHDLPGSSFLLSWDFTSDPCTFSGVLCSGDRVISLSLGNPKANSPGLYGFLHNSIGRLSSLQAFSLLPGRVSGSIPSSLFLLSNLRFLAITHNLLSGSIPSEISSPSRLHTVDLSYNKLSGSIPFSLSTLPTLRYLVLAHNTLTGEIPYFSSLELKHLALNNNNFSGSLSSLPVSLDYLSLSGNSLSGEVGFLVRELRRIRHLDLSFNQFSGPIPSDVFSLPLKELHLQRNLFRGAVSPKREVTIPSVDLSYNRLWGRVPRLMAGVRRLYLNSNRFMGEVPREIVEGLMKGTMETLYLQHNFLAKIDIRPEEQLPMRSALCVSYNCLVPPVSMVCPRRDGVDMVRPLSQCKKWKG